MVATLVLSLGSFQLAGSVIGATLLALYFVPAAYYVRIGLRSRFGKNGFSGGTSKMVINLQS